MKGPASIWLAWGEGKSPWVGDLGKSPSTWVGVGGGEEGKEDVFCLAKRWGHLGAEAAAFPAPPSREALQSAQSTLGTPRGRGGGKTSPLWAQASRENNGVSWHRNFAGGGVRKGREKETRRLALWLTRRGGSTQAGVRLAAPRLGICSVGVPELCGLQGATFSH